MSLKITLASTSQIRQQMLRSAGVDFRVAPSHFDEDALKKRLLSDGSTARQIAAALAAGKAKNVSANTDGVVIGCDQVLACGKTLFSKPKTLNEAREQLQILRGRKHVLLSAAVIYEENTEVWSHVGEVSLTMRDFSNQYLEEYLDRRWPSIQNSVGGYKLEEEGVRLFSSIEGDYFTVLGMPLMDILGYLGKRGAIMT